MEPLTRRQEKVLRFVSGYIARNGYAPSVREIAAALKIGTPKGAADHLKVLERKGYIRRTARRPRALTLLRDPGGIPLVGRIAAGRPTPAEQDIEDQIPLPPGYFGPGDCFALRVHGDSMIGDHILDGDLAIIRRQPTVRNGEIAAVLVDGEATLKRVHVRGSRVELRPSNPNLSSITVPADEIRILGRYVGLVRR